VKRKLPILDVDGGVGLFYSDNGKGIPIIFIHPPLLTSANFTYQIEALSQSFRVITFDIRGHGRSSYSDEVITYSLIVKDIIKLQDHLGIDKAFICGYSTGGSILLEFLLSFRDRAIGGIVVSGMSEASDRYLKQRISLAIKLANPLTISFLALAITWGNSDTKSMNKLLYEEAMKGDSRNINQYYQYSLEYNCSDQLEKIEQPILLVYGKKDISFHRYAHLLHKKLKRSELKFLSKKKHQLPTKAAFELNLLITDFVQHHGSNDNDHFY
jgi:pimeloyl-ACP methyl ester carboxylesterase